MQSLFHQHLITPYKIYPERVKEVPQRLRPPRPPPSPPNSSSCPREALGPIPGPLSPCASYPPSPVNERPLRCLVCFQMDLARVRPAMTLPLLRPSQPRVPRYGPKPLQQELRRLPRADIHTQGLQIFLSQ